ncbi:hypothetical protein EV714DRAFT_239378 [Schizophyllum commune]
MDPGTIIAVAQLTGKILQSLKKYASSVKDADAERTRLASQLTAIQCVLDNIKNHLVAGHGAPGCKALSENLRVLLNDGGSIALYMATLRELMGELNEGSKKMRLRDKLLWPLREEKMKDLLQKIGHYRIHFIMVYSLLTSERLAEVASTVASISEEQMRVRAEAEVREKRRELEEQEREHEKMKEDIVKWLDPVDNGLKHATVAESRQEGTCAWLFKHPTYPQWMEADHGLLMIHGTPGFGKTTLASSVIDHVRCGSHPTINYHYCDFREPASVDVTRILRTILAQAVRYLPSGTDELRDLSRRARDRKEHLASEEIIALLARSSTHCRGDLYVVDALDECLDPSSVLEKLRALSAFNGVHVLVTSRSEYRITELLGMEDFRICLMDQHDAIEKDIEHYIINQLSRRTQFRRFPDDLKYDISAQLLSNPNCMFRWAQCQLETLRKCQSFAAVKNTLRHLPRSLNETYERMLEEVDRLDPYDRRIIQRALQWLVGSPRLLTLRELNNALLIEVGERELGKYSPFDPHFVVDICGSLVYFEEKSGVVGLSHSTVKEYLTSTTWLVSPEMSSCAEVVVALHRELALRCVTYALLDAFDNGACDTWHDCCERSREFPFHAYVTQEWTYHVSHVKAYDESLYRSVMMLLCGRHAEKHRQALRQVEEADARLNRISPHLPWVYAARTGLDWLVKHMLLEHPEWHTTISLTGYDNVYGCPLEAAVKLGVPNVVSTLLKMGADVEGSHVFTPFHHAVERLTMWGMPKSPFRQIIHNLLDYGADVTTHIEAAHMLCLRGEVAILRRVLHLGFRRDAVGNDGEHILFSAVRGGMLGSALMLLGAGSDVDLVSPEGHFPLEIALHHRRSAMAQLLLDRGAATWPLSVSREDLAWATQKRWYQFICSSFELKPKISYEYIHRVYRVLSELGLPPSVCLDILDLGEFWVWSPFQSFDELLQYNQHKPTPPFSYFRFEICLAENGAVPPLELFIHDKPSKEAFRSYTFNLNASQSTIRRWRRELQAGCRVRFVVKAPGHEFPQCSTHILYAEMSMFYRFELRVEDEQREPPR